MPDKTLTDEGYLAVPGTSNQEVEMEVEDTINEDELPALNKDKNSATNQEKVQTNNRQGNVHSDTATPCSQKTKLGTRKRQSKH